MDVKIVLIVIERGKKEKVIDWFVLLYSFLLYVIWIVNELLLNMKWLGYSKEIYMMFLSIVILLFVNLLIIFVKIIIGNVVVKLKRIDESVVLVYFYEDFIRFCVIIF